MALRHRKIGLQRFEAISCPHLQGPIRPERVLNIDTPENDDNALPRNVGI